MSSAIFPQMGPLAKTFLFSFLCNTGWRFKNLVMVINLTRYCISPCRTPTHCFFRTLCIYKNIFLIFSYQKIWHWNRCVVGCSRLGKFITNPSKNFSRCILYSHVLRIEEFKFHYITIYILISVRSSCS